ncbi:MAG: sulfatase-like hydrolase/transferase [Verrucomicrobiota bacterium]|nr:sulfatase-like hydrolase/transferase [Verrucomicrobiota bacterium]
MPRLTDYSTLAYAGEWIARGLVLLAISMTVFATSENPNIVLILADDQGYGDASCYWPETDLKTPVMDRIAAQGIKFSQFRVNPLCAPTRASIITGTYSIYNGMWRGLSRPKTDEATGKAIKPETRVVHDDVRMLPEFLKRGGYATGLFGKWHLGYDEDNVPTSRGFDDFVGFLGGAHRYRWTKNSQIVRNGQPLKSDKHYTDLFADEAIRFIEENREQPFPCHLAFNAVHGPLRTEKRDADSARSDWLQHYEAVGVDQPRRDYNAVMRHADDRVGDILDTLGKLELTEETLVIYLSDNGGITHTYPSNNGPVRGGKGEAWEGGIRVPAVMQWPGTIPAGAVSTADAVHFDLFVTILDVAGIAIPKENGRLPVDGISLLDHLKSGAEVSIPDRYLFWDLFGKQGALHGPWKIVADTGNHNGDFFKAARNADSSDFTLVNLENDLGEKTDLASEHPEIYSDLKSRFVDWLRLAADYN